MQPMPPDDLRIRSHDESLRAALHRVDVPTRLPDRIKRAVEAEKKAAATVLETYTDPRTSLALSGSPTVRASRRVLNRRWFLAAATAASIGGVGAAIHYSRRPLDRDWLVHECLAALRNIESDSTAWQQLSGEFQDELASVASLLQPVRCTGVRKLAAATSVAAARAFRLDAGDGRGLVLLRMDLSRKLIGISSTHLEPLQLNSGDWAIAAMSVSKQVTALAVAGSDRDLMHYIRIGRQA